MGTVFCKLQKKCKMRFITSLLVLSLVCLASAYKHPERADCTIEAASKCVTEIGAAWDSCQDWTGPEEILACMENVIGATDCWDCVCTVLPSSLSAHKFRPILLGVTDIFR